MQLRPCEMGGGEDRWWCGFGIGGFVKALPPPLDLGCIGWPAVQFAASCSCTRCWLCRAGEKMAGASSTLYEWRCFVIDWSSCCDDRRTPPPHLTRRAGPTAHAKPEETKEGNQTTVPIWPARGEALIQHRHALYCTKRERRMYALNYNSTHGKQLIRRAWGLP